MIWLYDALDVYRCLVDVHIRDTLYMWKFNRDDSGVVQDIFKSNFDLENDLTRLEVKFWIPHLDFPLSENTHVQFLSKHHFLNRTLGVPSCRTCSHGPKGPF